ncbi:hypothetical protein [Streptomyces sp. NBC_00932]|uniref:VG15 protein n=1 Tax=Streptomyces sp. NBC_00932 TaxID=2903690 RepID=UPI00386D0575|nr:hypothetical protein OG221_27810 [Streptomyces sp. NBC_00932]
MADPGELITEQHRLGQVNISAGASRAVLDRWRQVSPTNLQETSASWLADSLALNRTYRRRSRVLTAAYVRLLRAFRTGRTLPPMTGPAEAETSLGELRQQFASAVGAHRRHAADDSTTVSVDEDFAWPDVDDEAEDRRAAVSLIVTGPVRAQRGIDALQGERGRLDDADFLADLDSIMRDAGALTAGAADRDALMGGRDLLDQSSRADRAVIGWARVTDSDPCHFCALLASRGAVYRSQWTARYTGRTGRRARTVTRPDGMDDWSPGRLASWEAAQGLDRYHDNCHCTIVPVYSRTDWLPEASRAFRELYDLSTDGLSGDDARRAFRRAIEARRRLAVARGVSVR